MPAGLRDVLAGDQEPRPGEVPLLEGQAEAVVRAAGVAYGGEALHQALFGAPHRAGRDVARRVMAVLVGDVLGHRADVHVGVGEAGHERGARTVDRRHRARQRAGSALGADVLDTVVLDDHGGALDGIGAGAVDQERVGEDGEAHRAITFASYIQTFSSARGVHSTVCATP